MIAAADLYLKGLRHSHTSVIRVTAYEGSTEIGPLSVVGLNITLDGTSDIQRSADITVAVDPLRSQSRDTLESLSTSKGSVVIEHAIAIGDFLMGDYVKLATLRVDEMESGLSKATRTLRCFDRTLLLQEYQLPTARPLNASYTSLIEALVAEAIPGETVSIDPSIDTALTPAPGKSFRRGDDRLRKIQELAEAVGAWLVCEPDGTFSLVPAPGTDGANAQAVQWNFNQGDQGVLIDSTSVFSRRDQYNAIGIEFVPADDSEWSGFLFMWDNDPASPTYFDGDFGRRTAFFTEEYDHLPSVRLAEYVGRRKLYEHSGVTRAIRVTGVYNPLLLPGDKVTIDVQNTSGGFDSETHYIERISLDLASAAMDVETRMARLPGSVGISVNGVPTGVAEGSLAVGTADATGVAS